MFQFFCVIHRESVVHRKPSVKVSEPSFRATPLFRSNSPAVRLGRTFLGLFTMSNTANINGMIWLIIVIRKVIDWVLEIPPDLLGRRIELFLDQAAERRRRGPLRSGRKKNENRKSMNVGN
jgi:hypothetical protein